MISILKTRQLHLLLGCFFAPLLIYFSFSGAWQVFRLNDVPKDREPNKFESILHELSKPHTHNTAPLNDAKTDSSKLFGVFSIIMALGIVLTSVFGVVIALQMGPKRKLALIALALGVLVPLPALCLK